MAEDDYLNNELFIRFTWSLYFQDSNKVIEPKYHKDVENLISITNLNKTTLIHTLYYLYLLVNHKPFLYNTSNSKLSSFQTSSRLKLLSTNQRKNHQELYELIIVLFMISNKANDDSSYTMKTWSNLTPLNNQILKKRELTVLKKIQYNVFLKNDEYFKWCSQLYQLGIKYNLIWESVQQYSNTTLEQSQSPAAFNYPPTPKSPLQDSYLPPIPSQGCLPLPPPQFSLPNLYTSSSAKRQSTYDYDNCVLTPFKKQQFENVYNTPTRYYTNQPSQLSQNQTFDNLLLTPIKTNYNNNNCDVQVQQQQQQVLQPEYQYEYSIPVAHPANCSCCALTNLTNTYHSSMKSMVKL